MHSHAQSPFLSVIVSHLDRRLPFLELHEALNARRQLRRLAVEIRALVLERGELIQDLLRRRVQQVRRLRLQG